MCNSVREMQTYQVNVEEAEKPLDQYRTLNDFFTRRLKKEVRPTASPRSASAHHALTCSLLSLIHVLYMFCTSLRRVCISGDRLGTLIGMSKP